MSNLISAALLHSLILMPIQKTMLSSPFEAFRHRLNTREQLTSVTNNGSHQESMHPLKAPLTAQFRNTRLYQPLLQHHCSASFHVRSIWGPRFSPVLTYHHRGTSLLLFLESVTRQPRRTTAQLSPHTFLNE